MSLNRHLFFIVMLWFCFPITTAIAQQGFGNTAKSSEPSEFGNETLEWRREYGSGEGLRTFSAMTIDHDDQSVILAGLSQMPEITKLFTRGGNPIEQLIVQKVDFFGNTLWIKPFSLSTTEPNRARSVSLMKDDSYLVSGYHGGLTSMQNYAVKIDEEGKELWKRRVGGVGDFVYYIKETPDNGFMAVGKKSYKGQKVSWLAKFNSDMRMIGESLYEDTAIGNLKFLEDSSFYSVAINYNPETGQKSLSLSKFSVTGEQQWQTFSMPNIELGQRRLQLSHVEYLDNHILVAGSAIDFSRGDKQNASMWLTKLNYKGEMLWSRTFEHDGEVGSFRYLAENNKGNTIAGAMRLQEAFGAEVETYFVTLSSEGVLLTKTFLGDDTISDIEFFDDGTVLITGERELNVKKYRSGRSYASSFSYVERKKLESGSK
ncbi:hypothetical protein [Idiomarina ramblicola]|uniref:Uncharacterized protein n=1 Tax=Idiomarina ramblicola TaxID=263724 RepID=A0A432Z605_9GAMM|nr:hypothetical protein [Idiomarina ramblicola]RUO73285.1 hypothetical protein CWI78_02225 [Idiomarina ramblicola]